VKWLRWKEKLVQEGCLLSIPILLQRGIFRDTLIGSFNGISYEGHKLQLLDFLAFLEEERRIDEVGALSSGGMKGKREVKKLECSINYDARGSCSRRGKRKARGHPVVS